MLFLPEGHTPDHSIRIEIKPILSQFNSILKVPRFFIYTLAGSFSFSGLFVYVAASPSIFMDGFQVSARQYGAIFAALSVGMIGGTQVNVLLGKRFSGETIFKNVLIVQVLISLLFFIGAWNQWYGLTSTFIFLFLLLSCCGLTYPNAASLALSPFTKNVGSASSLLGFIQMGAGALISSCVGLLEMKGSLPTATVISASSAAGLILLLAREHQLKANPLPDAVET